MQKKSEIKLEDYKTYPFSIPNIELDIHIFDEYVNVFSTFRIIPLSSSEQSLVLKGVDIKLIQISIDGKTLSQSKYKQKGNELKIDFDKNKAFDLRITSTINPFKNTSLEGLYFSGGIITSQCEAEGFRRICFHPDRPDVLSRFKVRIEADIKKYPILLSNGNKQSQNCLEANPLRHAVIWNDPFLKPSYLFAMVAGDLICTSEKFKTKSGKNIILKIYVEKGDEKYTTHAMSSLIRAMEWDENVYNLEYDLDVFHIVAVRHFNMGAMENKGLNIFNSKLILADSNIATDAELERIESVIAHEYFHNWTGNRITCRDWFQLSLKEGLTVFRDQSFTSDLHSFPVKRVQDVSFLRNTQFREDSGPTAHAVKPSKYLSIDIFIQQQFMRKEQN